jgi:hypothetical protein
MSMVEELEPRQKKPKGILDAFYNVASGLTGDAKRVAGWWHDAMKVPEGQTESQAIEKNYQQVGSGIADAAQHVANIPKRAIGASEGMRTTGTYNPEPVVEAASLPLGIGTLAGVEKGATEAILGAGLLRPKKPPPLIGGYHATTTPRIYEDSGVIKPGLNDIGAHMGVDPGVAQIHQMRLRGVGRDEARPRTIPVAADVKNAFRFPGDPTDWKDPNMVFGILEDVAERKGGKLSRSMITDFENIEKQAGGWKKNFIPAMKEKGYDSIFYPHHSPRDLGEPKYNSFMTFDEGQLMAKYSPKAQHEIGQRGFHEPMKTAPWQGVDPYSLKDVLVEAKKKDPVWSAPKGILSKYGDEEPIPQVKPLLDARNQRAWDEMNEELFIRRALLAEKHGIDLTSPEFRDVPLHMLEEHIGKTPPKNWHKKIKHMFKDTE